MGSHALITAYKNRELDKNPDLSSDKHPLILVVGREPNTVGKFVKATGTYNFDHAPKCAFWNESYAVVGKTCGMSGQALKQMCRDRNTSPIAFTDISPVLIRNCDPEKKRKRKEITHDQIDSHIKDIVSLNDELGRTAVVLLTGHRYGSLSKQARETFGYGATQLELALKFRKIPHISVPFMFGNNQSNILRAIQNDKSVSSTIVSTVQSLENVRKAA